MPVQPSGDLCDGAWHHAAFVIDGQTVKVYVDGVEVAEEDKVGTYWYSSYSGPFSLGAARVNGDARYYKGYIDEVAVYDRVLTAREIREHYRVGRP